MASNTVHHKVALRPLAKEHITIQVDFTDKWRFDACLWIAKQLIILAAWIAGMGVEFEGD